mmetsp:Transcript_2022/g.1910  ORF Transcript_2022/g.1910 Transcript_2022/m.1910 type:complete len:91 (-) Transcript_2022:58-330(-)
MNVTAYGIFARFAGAELNFLKLDKKVTMLLFGRGITGNVNFVMILTSIKLIPLSKATLILSLNPLSCAIVAAIFLKEKISPLTIGCILGA